MIILTIGNSYSKISGLSPSQEKTLKEELSFTVDAKAAYFSGRWGPRKKTLLGKKGDFPTGLLNLVLKMFPTAKIEDTRVIPSSANELFILQLR